jgi:uncharacterized membrane protein YfcA
MKTLHPLLAGLTIGALAYWFQPYNQTTVLGLNMWLIMAIGALLASALLIHYLDQKPPKIALRVTLGVLLAILARILYDTILWDPTSHNLAPLEIIFAGIATLPAAFAGAYLGVFIKKRKKHAPSKG